jgi:hypothetical protein
MKTTHYFILGSLLFLSTAVTAQDKKSSKPASPGVANEQAKQQEADQAKWMTYMTPGKMHDMMAKSNGDWHEDIVFWMDPKGPPTKAEAECSNSMIMGGRYQESIHKGDMMGMPFEGKGIMGYDNIKKVFQSTWIDNMGTGVMYMEGPYNEGKNAIMLSGTMIDPMSGKTEKARQVFTVMDEKTQKLEMFVTKNDKEFKSMEITMTKR